MNIIESANDIKMTLIPYEALKSQALRAIEDIDSRFEEIHGDLFNLRPEFTKLEDDIEKAIDLIIKGSNLPEELSLNVLLTRSEELFNKFK